MQDKINELFKLWEDHPGAGGQVVVTHRGKTIFEKCYGFANIELQVPMSQDSIFHVASVTKPFTAMCVMMLHERGLLNVYEDVRRYIPELIRFPQPLTVKQMLNHVSGLREYYDLFNLCGRSSEDHYAQREALDIVAQQTTLNFEPGSKFLYTNANYMLCATIVERLSGLSFPEFCKQNIFVPLGMAKSFIRDNPRMLVPNKVSSYHDNGYEYTNAILTFGLYGGTSLHTTCKELQIFMRQFIQPTLISRETMDFIMLDIPEINGKKGNYGCGIRVNELQGHRYIHHGGVNAGYRTVGQVYPEDDLIITAFANTYNIPIETAAGDIARIVLGLPPRVRKNLDDYISEPVDLTQASGLYYCDRNGDNFQVTVGDGIVYLDDVPMAHKGGNLYKQGRRNIQLALGEKPAILQDNSLMELRKLTDTIHEDIAADYLGCYQCKFAPSRFTLVWEDGQLMLRQPRFAPKPLHYLQEDTFFSGMHNYKFLRDETGKVTGFLFNSGHLTDFPFEKL